VAAALLAGCATVDEKASFVQVSSLVENRSSVQPVWKRNEASIAAADREARRILKRALALDDAVRLALLRNPSIQAKLARIGIAEADVVQAGRIRNPVVSIGRIAGGGILEIERQILVSLVSLFTLGSRTEIAKDDAERSRYLTALEVLAAVHGVRMAWIEAVAANERIGTMKRIFDAAESAEQLSRRMAAAGSMTALDQAKIKVMKAETAAQLGRLRIAEGMAREKLVRAIGLWGRETRFRLPSRLPGLPPSPVTKARIERSALITRLDVKAARKDIERLKKTIELTAFTGVVSLLEVSGYSIHDREREDGKTSRKHLNGVEVEFAIPIFDPGDAKTSRAKWIYIQAVNELQAIAIKARSEVREAYLGYRGTYDLARHYQRTLVPLTKQITEEQLLRYNGMLTGVFELLAANRQQSQALMTFIEARRDFWLAKTQLDYVSTTGSSTGVSPSTVTAAAGGGDEEH